MVLTVYQLKVVQRDVKPAVWRRVLVPGDATIRTLHETVQVVMGWANCHLHQFIIHGKEYGVAYEGGISFADSPDKVKLSDFRFQPHEGSEYVHDLGDNFPEALGAICLCGARENLTEGIGKRVHLPMPTILRISSTRTASTSSSVIFRVDRLRRFNEPNNTSTPIPFLKRPQNALSTLAESR
jgi:Plasmid pRiA4b ORF-3-like protein